MTTEECDFIAKRSREDAFSSDKRTDAPSPFKTANRSSARGSFTPTPRVGATSHHESTDALQMRKRRTRIGEQPSRPKSPYGQNRQGDFNDSHPSQQRTYNNDRYDRSEQRGPSPSYNRDNEEFGQKRATTRRYENEYDANRARRNDEYSRGGSQSFPHHKQQPREERPIGTKVQTAPQKKKKKKPIIPVKYQEVLADPNEPIRLNKYLSNAGVCSRREADLLIERGEVTVNGEVVTELGRRITRQDEVIYKGNKVEIESKVYVLLNKPKNCVTTTDDPECRTTVMEIVKHACPERIYPVGRLDRNTTGVLLITNDGDLASKLTHPSFKKKKIYHVWLNKDVSIEDMQKIADGVELEDGEIHADAISYVKEDDLSQVGIEIHSGRNRIVRRIFEHLGYRVNKLDRVYFAGLTKKNLPRGKWRYLNEQEVNNLRMGAFE